MDPGKLERAINNSLWSPKYEQVSRLIWSAFKRGVKMLIAPCTKILQEPYNYLSSIPGKEIRSKLIEAFNVWLDVPKEDLGIIKNVVRMLHTASLLYVALRRVSSRHWWEVSSLLKLNLRRMDDVEDDSQLRRGIPGIQIPPYQI